MYKVSTNQFHTEIRRMCVFFIYNRAHPVRRGQPNELYRLVLTEESCMDLSSVRLVEQIGVRQVPALKLLAVSLFVANYHAHKIKGYPELEQELMLSFDLKEVLESTPRVTKPMIELLAQDCIQHYHNLNKAMKRIDARRHRLERKQALK